MRIGRAIGMVGRSIGRRWRARAPEVFAVRYTPECACCGVPDDEAVRYPNGVSVCRECRAAESGGDSLA